jgi:hypothetical protein
MIETGLCGQALVRPIAALSTAPALLRSLLAPATPDDLAWKPPRDRWSITEILGHLVDVEGVVRRQASQIVDAERPLLKTYDPKAEYAKGTYSQRGADQQFSSFCKLRQDSVAWLRSLPAAAAERSGQHPELGPLRLEQIVHLWAFHDLGHVRQIAEVLRTASHWERMGPLQRLYRVRP